MKEVNFWFEEQGWRPQPFQKACWKSYGQGQNGMLHAPTGSGKTYAIWGGIVAEAQKVQYLKKGSNKMFAILNAGMNDFMRTALYDAVHNICLLYTSPSPRDRQKSRMPSSA